MVDMIPELPKGRRSMTLIGLAMVIWRMRSWGPIDPTEPAVTLRTWLFTTPKLDRRIDEWLGEDERGR